MGPYQHLGYSAPTSTRSGSRTEPRETTARYSGVQRSRKRATAARDVPPGQRWAFTGHRTMAEVIADEETQAT